MRLASSMILLLWGASASAQPGGTVNGAIQSRASSTTFAGNDNIIVLNSGIDFQAGRTITFSDPTLGAFQIVDWDTGTTGKLVQFGIDGEPSGFLDLRFPVSGKVGTFDVLFSQSLNSIAELDTQLGTSGSPAATNFLGGGNAWINFGTINERASAPSTPTSGFGEVWINTDGSTHVVDDAGSDHELVDFLGTTADVEEGAIFDILGSNPVAVTNRPKLYFRDDTQATPTPHPFIRDDTGIYQIVREPAGGITTGQVPVKQADGSWTGSTLSDDHSSLSASSRNNDGKSHPDLYELAMPADVDSMGEHSGHPDANVACSDNSPGPDQKGRRQIRTHGGVIWEARACTDTVGTSKWQPTNELMLARFGTTSSNTATGCLDWFGTGGFQASCTTAAAVFTARRAILITRVFLRDHLSTTNGANCKVAVWKNPTAADPDTDGADGTLILSDTTSFNGTAIPSKWYAVWDASMMTSEWTLAAGDTIGVELEDTDCATGAFQAFAELWGVPLE